MNPAERPSKHRAVYEALHREILAGKFAGDGRIPSEMQLVRRFRVSRPTVGRAILDLQRAGLLERRVGSGTYLRRTSTSNPASATKLFGLLVPGLGNTEILDPICREISRAAEQSGYAVLQGEEHIDGSSGEQALALCRQYIERKTAGVFFAPLELPADRDRINRTIVETLTKAGVPVILLDRDLEPFPIRSEFDLVGIDSFAAAFTLTRHLMQLGARHVAFVARPQYPSTTDQRIAGCREALLSAGRRDSGTLTVRIGDPTDADFVRGLRELKKLDAVVCSNDRTAAVLIQSLAAQGVVVPKQLRVVGFDDVKYATLLASPLTTMRLPCAAIGAAAVRAMLDRIDSPTLPGRQILLRAELVVRQSCGSTHT